MFAINTCNGCHSAEETNTFFLMVGPRSPGSSRFLSPFLTGTTVFDPSPAPAPVQRACRRRNRDLRIMVCPNDPLPPDPTPPPVADGGMPGTPTPTPRPDGGAPVDPPPTPPRPPLPPMGRAASTAGTTATTPPADPPTSLVRGIRPGPLTGRRAKAAPGSPGAAPIAAALSEKRWGPPRSASSARRSCR